MEVGEESNETMDKMYRLFYFVINSTDQEFVDEFEAYIDLDAMLNYYILADFAYLQDNTGKNMLMATYDGEKWYPSLYDLDTSWGTHWSGTKLYNYQEAPEIAFDRSNLFARFETLFWKELTQRYAELRDAGILTKENVMREFESFRKQIPQESFDKEYARWKQEETENGLPGYDYDQIRDFLEERIPYMESKYGK